MRLNEFTTDYRSMDTDAADFLDQIDQTWPASIGDDDVSSLIHPRQRPQSDPTKPSDAM